MIIINYLFDFGNLFYAEYLLHLIFSLLLCRHTVKDNDAQYEFNHEILLKKKLDKGLQKRNLTTDKYIVFFKKYPHHLRPKIILEAYVKKFHFINNLSHCNVIIF